MTQEWVPARDAAAALGVDTSHVRWLVERGRLVAELRGAQRHRWVRRDSLEALVTARAIEAATWVSYADAAALAGVSTTTIDRAVRRGDLVSRQQPATARPSLRRTDVEQWSIARAERHAAATARAAKKAARTGPPDDEHVWLDTATAALVLGITPTGVRYRVTHDLLPHVRRGTKIWLRRDHVEQVAAARAHRGRSSRPERAASPDRRRPDAQVLAARERRSRQ